MIGMRPAQIFWTQDEVRRLPPVVNPGGVPFTCGACHSFSDDTLFKRGGQLICGTCYEDRSTQSGL